MTDHHCLDCGGDGASRLELAAHCDPLPPVTVLGEWCPACAESVQRMRGAAMLHWLLCWHAQWGEERLAMCRRLESEVDDLLDTVTSFGEFFRRRAERLKQERGG